MYTDGLASHGGESTGAGVFACSTRDESPIFLIVDPKIITPVKMEAIQRAADLEDPKATSKNIVIFSDSQAVLERLLSPNKHRH